MCCSACGAALGASQEKCHECGFEVKALVQPELLRVVAAAARIVVEGHLVHDQVRELVFSVLQPGRHHNVMYLLGRVGVDPFRECEQGFVLSDGSFATRERALEVATAAGQIIRRCGGDHVALYSENLW